MPSFQSYKKYIGFENFFPKGGKAPPKKTSDNVSENPAGAETKNANEHTTGTTADKETSSSDKDGGSKKENKRNDSNPFGDQQRGKQKNSGGPSGDPNNSNNQQLGGLTALAIMLLLYANIFGDENGEGRREVRQHCCRSLSRKLCDLLSHHCGNIVVSILPSRY